MGGDPVPAPGTPGLRGRHFHWEMENVMQPSCPPDVLLDGGDQAIWGQLMTREPLGHMWTGLFTHKGDRTRDEPFTPLGNPDHSFPPSPLGYSEFFPFVTNPDTDTR